MAVYTDEEYDEECRVAIQKYRRGISKWRRPLCWLGHHYKLTLYTKTTITAHCGRCKTTLTVDNPSVWEFPEVDE